MNSLETYGTTEWFESLKWQHMWINYMVGWWVGQFGCPETVCDFGCGDGWWLKCFHDLGAKVGGIELYEIAKEYIPAVAQVLVADLRRPLDLGRGYDMTICLEVGEHMSRPDASTLCQTLAAHTKGHLLFSAAAPGQSGTGHINLQPQEWWRERIEQHTLKFSPLKTDLTRAAFGKITNELYAWLPRNLQVFARV